MSRRFWLFPVLGALLLAACTTPVSSPQAIQRLDPAELARIDAARPGRPLSLDEIVQQSRFVPPPILIETLRSTGTHHALTPSQAIRLRQQGVAPEVLDALADAHQRWVQDQATAEKVRRDTEQAAALDRARAEAERAVHRGARATHRSRITSYRPPRSRTSSLIRKPTRLRSRRPVGGCEPSRARA
ncbi:MAG: hypothetical protein HGA75_15490 [Thiobacillus sp.]|nr:hypothetical protein [Thiobacillus sp.]